MLYEPLLAVTLFKDHDIFPVDIIQRKVKNAMKLHIIFGISLLTVGTFSYAGSLCQQKEQSILKEINYARKYDNQHRVDGLQQALNEVRTNCSDTDLIKAHQEKIAQRKQKVAEREQELQQDKAAGGNRDKIKKREKKLAEARNDLEEVLAAPY